MHLLQNRKANVFLRECLMLCKHRKYFPYENCVKSEFFIKILLFKIYCVINYKYYYTSITNIHKILDRYGIIPMYIRLK